MKARPILFSAPMIRALLDGSKTQTRRAIKKQPQGHHWATLPPAAEYHAEWRNPYDRRWLFQHRIKQNREWDTTADVVCPFGKPGDLLWVRETSTIGSLDAPDVPEVVYRADTNPEHWTKGCRWIPSIHMPRWASRLTLRITDVRVQRLQEISEEDAAAEGLDRVEDGAARWGIKGVVDSWHNDPRQSYAALWRSINGPESWAANPWVWAISFDVIKSNVDEVLKA